MFREINNKIFSNLENKKWFEINDFNSKFPNVNFMIIKGKKNIGKSYQLNKLMRQIEKENKKFIYIRLTRDETSKIKGEWQHNANFPYEVIKANQIVNKESCQSVGQIAYLLNLQSLRSLSFENYSHIIFDEFVPFDAFKTFKNRDIEYARNFIRLISDVQRNKPDIKIYCFGNNDNALDIFTQYFKLNYKSNFLIDDENGILFANLTNLYKGADQDIVKGLAKYDKELDDFFKSNISFEDLSRITNYWSEEQSVVRYNFIYQGKIYAYLQRVQELENGRVQLVDEYSIKESSLEDEFKLLAFNISDNMRNEYAILLVERQIKALFKSWSNLIKFRKLKFSTPTIEREITSLIEFGL